MISSSNRKSMLSVVAIDLSQNSAMA